MSGHFALCWFRFQGVSIYLLIDVVTTIFQIFSENVDYKEGYILVLTALFVVSYLGYHGLYQSQILLPAFLLRDEIDSELKVSERGHPKQPSPFSEVELTRIHSRLQEVLENEHIHLVEDLTLSDLARKIGVTTKKLSTFINQEMQTNFYELINHHRVTTFTKQIQLVENSNLTIWGVATKCGFRSKTSFNRIFKKKIGMTPSLYYKSIQQAKSK